MMDRCPHAGMIGIGYVEGYQFALDSEGVGTVEKKPEDHVWGVVWEVTGRDIVNLDRYEGVAGGCYEHQFIDVQEGDHPYEVLMYVSKRGVNRGKRRNGYMEKVVFAAEKMKLPEEYIKTLRLLS